MVNKSGNSIRRIQSIRDIRIIATYFTVWRKEAVLWTIRLSG